MQPLHLHSFHQASGARFTELRGSELIANYGKVDAEYSYLTSAAGLLDLSFRGRLCLVGADRIRFLHGQVTNDIQRLKSGQGCYAALTTSKGRMETDLNVIVLKDEVLLDFEPGFTPLVAQRLEKFIVSDDVQLIDVAPLYGLFSIQGPRAEDAIKSFGLFPELPAINLSSASLSHAEYGELYLVNHGRLGFPGYDLFFPVACGQTLAAKLEMAVKSVGGGLCGSEAAEVARVEAGIPLFGVDMTSSHFPQEAGIESRAVSYTKGCYIGQEILNRIHTQGHVNKQLVGLLFPPDAALQLSYGDKLFSAEQEIGSITSSLFSLSLQRPIALAYVRREHSAPGETVTLKHGATEIAAEVSKLPFRAG